MYAAGGDSFGGPAMVEAIDPDGHPIWITRFGAGGRVATSAVFGPDRALYVSNADQVFRLPTQRP